jgi:hypothetical protein
MGDRKLSQRLAACALAEVALTADDPGERSDYETVLQVRHGISARAAIDSRGWTATHSRPGRERGPKPAADNTGC